MVANASCTLSPKPSPRYAFPASASPRWLRQARADAAHDGAMIKRVLGDRLRPDRLVIGDRLAVMPSAVARSSRTIARAASVSSETAPDPSRRPGTRAGRPSRPALDRDRSSTCKARPRCVPRSRAPPRNRTRRAGRGRLRRGTRSRSRASAHTGSCELLAPAAVEVLHDQRAAASAGVAITTAVRISIVSAHVHHPALL